jgi:phospholipid transport system substrate-binding protein
MVSKDLNVKSAKELNGATICVQPGTTTELNLADWFRGQKIEFKPLRAAPTDTEVEVNSQVISSRGGEPIQLSYRLEKKADGWKLYDVNVLGAWLVEAYRGTFSNEINKGGIDGLIKALTDKNQQLAARGNGKK